MVRSYPYCSLTPTTSIVQVHPRVIYLHLDPDVELRAIEKLNRNLSAEFLLLIVLEVDPVNQLACGLPYKPHPCGTRDLCGVAREGVQSNVRSRSAAAFWTARISL